MRPLRAGSDEACPRHRHPRPRRQSRHRLGESRSTESEARTGIQRGTDVLAEFLLDTISTQMCTVAIRTQTLRDRGGFPPGWHHAGDLVAWVPLLLDGDVGFVNEACGTHTTHADSQTAAWRSRRASRRSTGWAVCSSTPRRSSRTGRPRGDREADPSIRGTESHRTHRISTPQRRKSATARLDCVALAAQARRSASRGCVRRAEADRALRGAVVDRGRGEQDQAGIHEESPRSPTRTDSSSVGGMDGAGIEGRGSRRSPQS